MVALLQIAELADAVYKEESAYGVPPFKCQWWVPTTGKSKGFQGGIFHDDRQIIVAFKGTKPTSVRDLTADLRIGFSNAPNQAKIAYELTQAAQSISEGRTIMITGHSLGGGLAQIVGYWSGLPFFTFNAPPMASSGIFSNVPPSLGTNKESFGTKWSEIWSWLSVNPKGNARGSLGGGGMNFRVQGDPVSSSTLLGGHIGPVRTLKRPGFFSNPHGMGTVIKAIKSDRDLRQ